MPGTSPAVTAILLSHNCAGFIGHALRSVLAQDCPPMEVIVSDDASIDDSYTVLQRELEGYRGPHRVTLRRRETNSGSKSGHLNDVYPLASGAILISFDGDDISEPRRVGQILDVFRRDDRVTAVYSDYAYMDDAGKATSRRGVRRPPLRSDPRRWFARVGTYAPGATLAVRRDVIDTFGPLDPRINEDVVLPFRASLMGDVNYLDDALVRVRRWQGSLTADTGRFRSMDAFRAWMVRGIAQSRRHLDSRLDDLRRAEALGLVPAGDLATLRRAAQESMAEAEASAAIVSPRLWVRLGCLARMLRPGADRNDLLQSLFLAFAPETYLRYKRRWVCADHQGTPP